MGGAIRHTVTLAAGVDSEVCGQSSARKSIILPGAADLVVFYFHQAMAAVGEGIPVGPNGPPLILDRSNYGDMIGHPWHAICAAGPTITVVEVL